MSNYTAPVSPSTTPAGAPPQETGGPSQTQPPGGPPYPPRTAQLGLLPSPNPDIPISAAFLGLFVIGAATNMTIFQLNQRRSYKFFFSVLLFGFCMARIVALSMRIVWATQPRNVNVGIASQIFTACGVLILFITNLIFAQRIIRAYHPFFGWSRGVSWLFRIIFGSVVFVLVMVISVTVQSFFTLDEQTRKLDRRIQLFSGSYMGVYAFLPVPLVLIAAMVPRRTRIDKFGEGHFRTKFGLLTFTATLLAAGAVFRAVVNFYPRPLEDPGWYHGKPAYYCFNFGVEVIVVYTYALARFDKRFHIPDGSSAPGHYSHSFAPPTGGSGGKRGAGMMMQQLPTVSEEFERGSSSYTYDKVDGGQAASQRGGWGKRTSTGSGSVYSSVAGGIGGGGGQMIRMAAPLPPPSVYTHGMMDVELDGRNQTQYELEAGGVGGERDGATRAEDMAWMSRALRELYGEDETEIPRTSRSTVRSRG
ncbi:hypothetical protein QBC38DRAFT_424866 [Podospora fimiseda]|uniref:Uncharacterized protein n=1 Tax=Podospora fimiseda TaxID=252190 RepID=A0AAN7GPG3_9PEZI|nr:hypothetical protein QBC38DRAFT_424866 [Podospora fimiseda]